MESVKTKTAKGKVVYILQLNEDESPMDYDSEGMCIACGKFQSGVEPDATGYDCESCGEPQVYGLEELFIMGYAQVKGEA